MKISAIQNTFAKKQPIQSSLLSSSEILPVKSGRVFGCESIEDAQDNHVKAVLSYAAGTWYFYRPHVEIEGWNLISRVQLQQCLPMARGPDILEFYVPLNSAMREFKINTPARCAAFIAQIAHESGSLRYREEIASGAAYEGRRDLGNIVPGDGRRYKGRGLLQLTGRNNYSKVGRALGLDLEGQPNLASVPFNSARIAGYYWHSRGLNQYADWNTEGGFKRITRLINGGYNGWRDRLEHWQRAREALIGNG